MKRKMSKLVVLLMAIGFFLSPILGYALNHKKATDKVIPKEESEQLKKTEMKEIVTSVSEQQKKEQEEHWTKQREEEARKKFDEYIESVPFGDEIQINLNDEADKIGVSILRADVLEEENPLYQELNSEIKDAEQFVQISYSIDVKTGSVDYNGLIFNYFDEVGEAGAVVLDDTEGNAHLDTYKEASNKVVVAFKHAGNHLSAKIGNATFKGKINKVGD